MVCCTTLDNYAALRVNLLNLFWETSHETTCKKYKLKTYLAHKRN